MADTDTPVETNAALQTESGASGETGDGSAQAGEAGKGASVTEGTAGEGLYDGMSPEQLHKSYKSIQGEYTKQREILKQFERFGGPEELVKWADYLSKNPEFSEWVKGQQTKTILGVDESQLDEPTKKAYETVRRMSEAIAENKIQQLVKNEIEPLSKSMKEDLLERHFDAMDRKFGKEWHELRDAMSELSEDLPPQVQDRPTFEDVEDLYWKAARKTGKFDQYAAKAHERRLAEKKGKSVDKPGAAHPSAPKPSKSIQEAFAEAKRQMGLPS